MQEKKAWFYEEVLKFCECGDCGTEVSELTNAKKKSNAEPNSEQKSISSSNQQALIIITSSLSSVILILSLTFSLYYMRKRQQRNTSKNNGKQGFHREYLAENLSLVRPRPPYPHLA